MHQFFRKGRQAAKVKEDTGQNPDATLFLLCTFQALPSLCSLAKAKPGNNSGRCGLWTSIQRWSILGSITRCHEFPKAHEIESYVLWREMNCESLHMCRWRGGMKLNSQFPMSYGTILLSVNRRFFLFSTDTIISMANKNSCLEQDARLKFSLRLRRRSNFVRDSKLQIRPRTH